MTRKAFSFLRATRPLHLALALALLFATSLDLGHAHHNPAGELQCYTCHFSPDQGLASAAADPVVGEIFSSPNGFALPKAPRAAATLAYTARGPPLPV